MNLIKYNDFATHLNKHLIRRERSAAWLARQLSVHPSTVSKWINGESRPRNYEAMLNIIEALGVSDPVDQRKLFVTTGYTAYLENTAEPVGFKRSQAIEQYFSKLHHQYSTMRILGKFDPISLEGIYTDVHILDRASIDHCNIEVLKKRGITHFLNHRQEGRKNGLEVVRESNNLFILGKPGSGKTTFLRYLVLQSIAGKISKIPIYIALKEWSISELLDIKSLVIRYFETYDFPYAKSFAEDILKTGQAVVLFDGLDEVRQDKKQRLELSRRLNEFADIYAQTQCLITCRNAADEEDNFEQFQKAEIADFNKDQIEQFVIRWFGKNPEKKKSFLEDFYTPKNYSLRELASVPLLLSLLCLAFENNMAFPKQRVELYEDAVDVLLRRWDSSRNIRRDEIYRDLSPRRKQRMFAHIAKKTFENSDYFIPQENLEEQIRRYLEKLPQASQPEGINSRQILKAIEAQHSIFVEQAPGLFSFSHLTFHEYFTAKYIVDNALNGTLKELVTDYLTDNRWREIFFLTTSLLDEADCFFSLFLQRIHELIADDNKLVEFVEWAVIKASTISEVKNKTAVRASYLHMELVRERNYSRDRDQLIDLTADIVADIDNDILIDRSLIFAFARDRDYAQERSRERFLDSQIISSLKANLEKAGSLFKESKYNPEIVFDFTLVCTLQTARIFELISDKDVLNLYPRYKDFFAALSNFGQQIGGIEIQDTLQELSFPAKSISNERWSDFCVRLEEFMIEHRNIGHKWDFDTKQRQKLATYFSAIKLFRECLAISYVSKREEIEDGLFVAS